MYITVCVFQLYIYGSDKMSFTAILETVPDKNQNILFYRPPELLKQLTKRKYGIYRRFPKIWLSKTTAST